MPLNSQVAVQGLMDYLNTTGGHCTAQNPYSEITNLTHSDELPNIPGCECLAVKFY